MNTSRRPSRSVPQSERPRVLWVSSELAPYASTGGLGEVVGTLPARLRDAGWDVSVLLPYYRAVRLTPVPLDIVATEPLPLTLGRRAIQAEMLRARAHDGVPLLLLRCDELYDRDTLYGNGGGTYGDNALRFAVLCAAALEVARHADPPIQILHLHDWQAALTPVLQKTVHADDPLLARVRTVLTLHNIAYQGVLAAGTAAELGLPAVLHDSRLLGWGAEWNVLKGGILFADRLTTVSPRYVREIRAGHNGFGLHDALHGRSRHLTGILNGIDERSWDPAHDPAIAAPYSAADLSGKERCKASLQREMGLPVDAKPALLGFVGRLVEQKGIDILLDALPQLLRRPVQLVVLGNGHPNFEQQLTQAVREHAGHIAVRLGFDPALAHRVQAGCDMLLMPSRFEPCGLSQMEALRYGTVPIVRAVGGLADTVRPITSAGLRTGRSNGFLFQKPTAPALLRALDAALRLYAQPARWRDVLGHILRQDWSWSVRVPDYDRLYRSVAEVPLFRPPEWDEALAAASRAAAAPLSPADGERREPPIEAPYLDWGPELPTRYGEDAIALLVQSPQWLFTYWEVEPRRYAALGGRPDLVLSAHGPRGVVVLGDSFGDVGDRWVPAEPGARYHVELRARTGELLLASAEVRTPRDQPSERGDVRWVHAEERLRRTVAAAAAAAAVGASGPATDATATRGVSSAEVPMVTGSAAPSGPRQAPSSDRLARRS